MIYPNKVELKIGGTNGADGVDYSKYVVFPIKWNSLLSEQLDEGFVSLLRCPVEIFKPLTPVYLRVYNEGSGREYKKYFVVNADNADEIPAGSGLWNHGLRLIEITKKLERIVCPSMGFVNPIKRNFPIIGILPQITLKDSSGLSFPDLKERINTTIQVPKKAGENLNFPSWYEVTGYNSGNDTPWTISVIYLYDSNFKLIKSLGGDENRAVEFNAGPLSSGTYILRYYAEYYKRVDNYSEFATWDIDYYITVI